MHSSSSKGGTSPIGELRLVSTRFEDIKQPELRKRASDGSWTRVTKLYLATLGIEQVGFLSVDLHAKDFFIYEIYVAREHRRKQVGSFLLEEAEKVATSHGYAVALLKPHALDPEYVGRHVLLEWYVGRGYVPVDPGDSEYLIKRLTI